MITLSAHSEKSLEMLVQAHRHGEAWGAILGCEPEQAFFVATQFGRSALALTANQAVQVEWDSKAGTIQVIGARISYGGMKMKKGFRPALFHPNVETFDITLLVKEEPWAKISIKAEGGHDGYCFYPPLTRHYFAHLVCTLNTYLGEPAQDLGKFPEEYLAAFREFELDESWSGEPWRIVSNWVWHAMGLYDRRSAAIEEVVTEMEKCRSNAAHAIGDIKCEEGRRVKNTHEQLDRLKFLVEVSGLLRLTFGPEADGARYRDEVIRPALRKIEEHSGILSKAMEDSKGKISLFSILDPGKIGRDLALLRTGHLPTRGTYASLAEAEARNATADVSKQLAGGCAPPGAETASNGSANDGKAACLVSEAIPLPDLLGQRKALLGKFDLPVLSTGFSRKYRIPFRCPACRKKTTMENTRTPPYVCKCGKNFEGREIAEVAAGVVNEENQKTKYFYFMQAPLVGILGWRWVSQMGTEGGGIVTAPGMVLLVVLALHALIYAIRREGKLESYDATNALIRATAFLSVLGFGWYLFKLF